MSVRKGLITATQVAVLVAVIGVAMSVSSADDWQPISLVGLLFARGADLTPFAPDDQVQIGIFRLP